MKNLSRSALSRFAMAVTLIAVCGYGIAQSYTCPEVSEEKIARTDAIWNLGDAAMAARSALSDSTVGLSVQGLGAENPAWSPLHPKWKEIEDAVRSDMRRILESALTSYVNETRPMARCTYARVLSDDEIEGLRQYLESPVGQRQRQLGNDVDKALATALGQMKSKPGAARDDEATAENVPESVVQARRDLMQSTFKVAVLQSTEPALQGKQDNASGDSIMGYLYTDFALQITALDALVTKYASDLILFKEFNRSALMAKFSEALGELQKLPMFEDAGIRYLSDISEGYDDSEGEWKRRYEASGAANAPAQIKP